MTGNSRSDFEAWIRANNVTGFNQKCLVWQAWLSSRRQALEEAAAICDQVDVQQQNDNGIADTGGAAACASAIRREAEGK